jgi:hypothetical protein
MDMAMGTLRKTKRWMTVLTVVIAALILSGTAWFQSRYDASPDQIVELRTFSPADYPEDPEDRSTLYGKYHHDRLRIEQLDETRFRLLLLPRSPDATTIELANVDLKHMVASVPDWVKGDPNLTKVGLIDREWNRQQVSFARRSEYVQVREGGDGFEQRALSRVDLARNCLNAGLWEVLLFTREGENERIYEHYWFTFPLGLYKHLFERVNGLSYWDYWWSLEHWVDPTGTPIHLDRLRTVEQEWDVPVAAHWDEQPPAQGEQRLKQKNVLTGPAHTYRDWYAQPVRFASFVPPGRYSIDKPRDTKLQYLAELSGAKLRKVRTPAQSEPLFEITLAFRDSKTGKVTRLIFGGLDFQSIPSAATDQYHRGWQAPMGIGNPSFFEAYEQLLALSPLRRPFYAFHLDDDGRWIDHHAVGVDGPLLHWDAKNPSMLHLYLLSYERHALLSHISFICPTKACQRQDRQTPTLSS